jgi:hypothetical protein
LILHDRLLDDHRQLIRVTMRRRLRSVQALHPNLSIALIDFGAVFREIPNSSHSATIVSPSSKRATNRSRSSIT